MITVNTNPKVLGNIKVGVPTTFQYALTSAAQTVKIVSLRAGCGSCTLASIEKDEIAPNSTVILNVTFTPDALGEQTKEVTVTYTEATITSSIALSFSANVIN